MPQSARSPYPRIALVLSGGNALGAYAAGAYEALHGHGREIDLISGASIGAINGAIIAGNPFDCRIDRLREFWAQAASGTLNAAAKRGGSRERFNQASVLQTMLFGRPGLFAPRMPGLLSALPGMPSDVAIFDHRATADTLRRLIDFDLLNSARVPLIVNALDAHTGEAVRFDNRVCALTTEHLLASTSMSPFYPPVAIDGQPLLDPGLVENLPLDAVLDAPLEQDLLCFAVDAFVPNGERLHDLDTVSERAQDIAFAGQSRRTLRRHIERHRLRRIVASLTPERETSEREIDEQWRREGSRANLTIVFIAYRARPHELAAKSLDFSKASIAERWTVGREDMERALEKLDGAPASRNEDGLAMYDCTT